MGYVADQESVVVKLLIGPGPRAEHRRNGFLPDAEYQQERIEAIYHKSAGVCTYLGDWHTHPTTSARLSHRDKRTLASIAADDASQTRSPIMAVLGNYDDAWKLHAYIYKGTTGLLFRRHLTAEMSTQIY